MMRLLCHATIDLDPADRHLCHSMTALELSSQISDLECDIMNRYVLPVVHSPIERMWIVHPLPDYPKFRFYRHWSDCFIPS